MMSTRRATETRHRAEALGASFVGYDPTSAHTAIVMTDPEGIEFCIIGPVHEGTAG